MKTKVAIGVGIALMVGFYDPDIYRHTFNLVTGRHAFAANTANAIGSFSRSIDTTLNADAIRMPVTLLKWVERVTQRDNYWSKIFNLPPNGE